MKYFIILNLIITYSICFCSCSSSEISKSDVVGVYSPVGYTNNFDTLILNEDYSYSRRVYDYNKNLILAMNGKWEYLGNGEVDIHSFYLNLDDDLLKYPQNVLDTNTMLNTYFLKEAGGIIFGLNYGKKEHIYKKVDSKKEEPISEGEFQLGYSENDVILFKENYTTVIDTIEPFYFFYVQNSDTRAWLSCKRRKQGYIKNNNVQVIDSLSTNIQVEVYSTILDHFIDTSGLDSIEFNERLIELEYDYYQLGSYLPDLICESKDSSLILKTLDLVSKNFYSGAEYNTDLLTFLILRCPYYSTKYIEQSSEKIEIYQHLYALKFYADENLDKDSEKYEYIVDYYEKTYLKIR